MKTQASNRLDPDQEESYLKLSNSLHGYVEKMATFKNADFAQFSLPFMEESAKAFKYAEKMFLEMAVQSQKRLSTLAKDHPMWDQAKRNFDITTATASKFAEIRRRLDQFIANRHFDKGGRQ